MYSQAAHSRQKSDLDQRKMDDMNCIIEGNKQEGSLYLGNIKVATNHRELKKHNIGAVLSVCPVEQDGQHIMHMIIAVEDVDDQDLSQYFEQAYNFIEKARKVSNIIIHCQAGISRSTTILLSYLVKKYLIGVKEALKMVESKRWQIFPNNGFLRQLAQYERKFFSGLIVSVPPIRDQTLHVRLRSEESLNFSKMMSPVELGQRDLASVRNETKNSRYPREETRGAGAVRGKVEYPRFAQYEGMASLYSENKLDFKSVYLENRHERY